MGKHSLTWDATDGQKRPLPSGIYFYRLDTHPGTIQKKMILLR
jgi:hypothetical protein